MEDPHVVMRVDRHAADLPVTHLFGSACDQSGSGSNYGTGPVAAPSRVATARVAIRAHVALGTEDSCRQA